MTEEDLRLAAVQYAITFKAPTVDGLVQDAEAILKFLKGAVPTHYTKHWKN